MSKAKASSDDSHLIPRIINHMNKDHSHNLEDYLVVYAHVDPEIAKRRPTMETLNLGSMSLSYIDMEGTKCFIRIPIEPTMESFHDARAKLVEMAQVAAARRGFSEYLVNDVPFLTSFKEYVFVALFISLYTFALKPHLLQYIVDDVLALSPEASKFIMDYHVTLLRGLLLVHVAEAILILYPLLRKFRMGTLKKLSCLILCLIEGIFFLSAFKETVDRAQNPNRNKGK